MGFQMEQFQKGDVVRLKSGGPTMTIDQINGSIITCIWFEGPKKQEGIFDAAVLELIENQQQPTGARLRFH